MRKIVLSISVSLDGYFEGPNREIDWHLVDEEVHSHFNEVLGTMSVFIEGRVTYELMDEFWPDADSDPDVPASMAEFARIWRRMPKIVYSRTLQSVDEGIATIEHDVDPAKLRALQEQPGGDMVVGGPNLAATFRRHDLIDEYRIYVHPVLLGDGHPLFDVAEGPTPVQLVETRVFGNGVVLLRYGRPSA